jgi:hypothetical protein
MAATADTVSIESAREDPDPSFFSEPIEHVPSRDLQMRTDLMFDHIVQNCIHNPITHSEDPDHPSLQDILLDHLKSRNAWHEAIQVQMRILHQNKAHIIKIMSEENTRFQYALINNEMGDILALDGTRPRMNNLARKMIQDSAFLNEFYIQNRSILVPVHESDADEPFNLFRVKLPVWCIGDQGSSITKWTSLEDVLRVFVRESVNPRVPDGDFCPIRYLRRIFSNRVIYERMSTQRRDFHCFQNIMNRIRSKVKARSDNHTYSIGVFVRDTGRVQHSQMGKVRYTLGVILRWLELTHYFIFRDQVSHSILHSFYRNIHTRPIRIHTNTIAPAHKYLRAHIRTLTSENMPEDPDDPVLYIPFEVGMSVYKMGCCRKDICSDSIMGILRSGRTPVCPMCRAPLPTDDPSFARNPAIQDEDDDRIEIIPDEPLYMRTPLIPILAE